MTNLNYVNLKMLIDKKIFVTIIVINVGYWKNCVLNDNQPLDGNNRLILCL